MQYLISFLEGMITFISPCLLPMLPIYISYFAGGGTRSIGTTLKNACGFVLGFTLVFVAMGALSGIIGSFLIKYQTVVNIISGVIVICFGLQYLGVLRLKLFRTRGGTLDADNLGFISSAIFGMIFSVGWTPCVGAFLGSALLLASQSGQMLTGMGMLLCYSLGLGVPFLFSAVLIDRLKDAFAFIKRHYGVINTICGGLLIVIGILMATGVLGRLLTLLS